MKKIHTFMVLCLVYVQVLGIASKKQGVEDRCPGPGRTNKKKSAKDYNLNT